MSDKIVNLTELAAVRAKMTHGKYENDGSLKRDVWSGSLFVAGADRQADADGIVATHNAADVLIEAVRMAKRLDAEDGIRDSKTGYALRDILAKVSL